MVILRSMAAFPLICHVLGYRYDSNSGGEREIQRTMLELLNQLDGFDSRGDVKVSLVWNFNVHCPSPLREPLPPTNERKNSRLCSIGHRPLWVRCPA